ncbi:MULTISPECIES: copper-binding protein [Paraburkholderia]|uniref:Copper-binding protein n=1 Tax=Paraburkholderia madseniana TaxID=2599607 RepID=A0AAP5BMC8_9BURK|nr:MULTISPECIES: copper-binding protein [Paraburkholderia]MCX4151659.1 copper-binding protein [Paraburkholderia madseniana]MCX4176933.1 copper-binding protein [Paraburkholderia madseniana]MDN7154588.1 copper-binding protein [Paraburkholderia sp. WS6]MDQ6413471.1 copper-binding protein [Paraburkholderia madseniana]MDQ6464924.1 copper-binding protein [Paraburkholderia madseniana]
MKKLIIVSVLFCTASVFAGTALAADDMAGMKMKTGAMDTASSTDTALTDAVVKKVDPSTGMVTLQHGDLKNIGMSAMTMAYKAKDTSMVKRAKEGEKVKVRVESVNGTLTIVKLEKQQ